jgi:hypothetical protein
MYISQFEDLIDDNIWGNRDSASNCQCGTDVATHLPSCYYVVLRDTLAETKKAALMAIAGGLCTFRAATFLKSWCHVELHHPESVKSAQVFLNTNGACWKCGGTLVPIGNARNNGALHDDWNTRHLHKKCWKELVDDV